MGKKIQRIDIQKVVKTHAKPQQIADLIGVTADEWADVPKQFRETIAGACEYMRWQRDKIIRKDLAEIVGVAPSVINDLVSKGIFEEPMNGEYNRHKSMKAIVHWFRGRMADGATEFGALKKQKMERENRLLEYQLQREQKQVIQISIVEREWSNLMLNCRQKLLRIGNKVAPRVPYLRSEVDIEKAIQDEIEEALTELSRPIDYEDDKQAM